jgi:hypothetical protein
VAFQAEITTPATRFISSLLRISTIHLGKVAEPASTGYCQYAKRHLTAAEIGQKAVANAALLYF